MTLPPDKNPRRGEAAPGFISFSNKRNGSDSTRENSGVDSGAANASASNCSPALSSVAGSFVSPETLAVIAQDPAGDGLSAAMLAADAITAKRRLSRMRAGVVAAARAINNTLIENETPHRAAMITLTYRDVDGWQPNHITQLIRHYRQWFKRRGHTFQFVWTLEMQKRGAPHYHIVTWIPKGLKPPLPDRQGWWTHGMSQAIFATSPVGYIAKYASKGPESALPKGARIWGYGGVELEGKFEVVRALAPRWLKKVVSPAAQLKRIKVGLEEVRKRGAKAVVEVAAFLDKLTGFVFLSPWIALPFTGVGLPCRHQGFVECFSPDGDYFKIPTKEG